MSHVYATMQHFTLGEPPVVLVSRLILWVMAILHALRQTMNQTYFNYLEKKASFPSHLNCHVVIAKHLMWVDDE
jgi:hypothetical protein